MGFKTSIAREDEYRKQLFAHYNSILEGRLMKIDPNTANDSEISSFVTDFNKNELYDNNCCSWLIIGDIGYSDYMGNNYNYINLLPPPNGDPIQINFSQFKYGMSAKQGYEGFASFDPEQAVHICTVDDSTIIPETFFSAHKGEKLLYLYSFDTVTAFNSPKKCFRFALNNVSHFYIRRSIRDAQIAVLENYLSNPATNIPDTFIKIEIEGVENSQPNYQHVTKSEITDKFALNIFEEEFKNKFIEKLKLIKSHG